MNTPMPTRSGRPVRSSLTVPAIKRDWIRKAPKYGSDAVIMDLEDSVQLGDKPAARAIAAEELPALAAAVGAAGVRVNASEPLRSADLESVVQPGLSLIHLAKVRGPGDIEEVDRILNYLEGRRGMALGTVAILPVMETATAIHNAYEIAMASPRIEYMGGLVSPAGDTAFALRLRVTDRQQESLYLRSAVLWEARAAGVRYPRTGVVADINPDLRIISMVAEEARALGYSGMSVIHPSHIPVVNRVFS